jgi:hypothetical protein
MRSLLVWCTGGATGACRGAASQGLCQARRRFRGGQGGAVVCGRADAAWVRSGADDVADNDDRRTRDPLARDRRGERVDFGVAVRTRPRCPYPKQSRYKGSGDINDASNFICQ